MTHRPSKKEERSAIASGRSSLSITGPPPRPCPKSGLSERSAKTHRGRDPVSKIACVTPAPSKLLSQKQRSKVEMGKFINLAVTVQLLRITYGRKDIVSSWQGSGTRRASRNHEAEVFSWDEAGPKAFRLFLRKPFWLRRGKHNARPMLSERAARPPRPTQALPGNKDQK